MDSKDLIEKTSREGFIENAAYNCFVKAVLYAISCVENDRMQDKADLRAFYSGNFKEPVIGSVRHLSEIVDKKVKDEDVKKELQQLYANLAKFHIDGQRFVVDHIKRPLQQYAECYNLKGVTSRIRKAIEK